jgi:simple sugar transport system permease protein
LTDAGWPDLLASIWLAAAGYGGPLLLATVGELLAERSGVLNLGLEGIVAAGALVAFGTSATTGDPWLGLAAGAGAGLALGAVHAALAVSLGADQIVAGLGLTLGATGAAGFLGPLWLARLGQPAFLPDLGGGRLRLFLGFSPTTHLAVLAAAAVAWLLGRTRLGLAVRACGDAPEAAAALGVPVRLVRWGCVVAGGALAGVAGGALSLGYARTWASTLPNGLGWIAIALVPLSRWKPGWAAVCCLLLAGVGAGQLRLQLLGVRVPSSLLDMLPYLATLLAVVAGRLRTRGAAAEPAALGRPFEA